MVNRTAKKGEVVSYRNTDGETSNALVTGDQPTAPAQPASSTATTGGTLAAATYSYRITQVVAGIESLPSVAKTQVTTGTTSTVTIDWTTGANTAATSYKVYGRNGGSELLIATVAMPTTTYVDTGSVTPSGALPTATGLANLKLYHSHTLLTGVAKATTQKATNVYFNRL